MNCQLFHFINNIINIYKQNISSEKEIYCFFDEIQYSQDWNSWLKVLYDTTLSIKIMATGSASPVLSEKTKESGLGRWITLQVPTLTFYEHCKLLNLDKLTLPPSINPMQFYLLDTKTQTDIVNKLSFFAISLYKISASWRFPRARTLKG